MGTLPLLVDTHWLTAHLKDPDLRILDSTANRASPIESLWSAQSSRRGTSPARSLSICRPTSPITTAI